MNGSKDSTWRGLSGRGLLAAGALTLLAAGSVRAGQLVQDPSFTTAVFDYIAKSEYEIRWIEDQEVHKSANRAQNLRFTCFNDGFAVEPRDYGKSNPKPWEITMRLQSFGNSAAPGLAVANAKWAVKQNTASVTADGIVIEYHNDTTGMRQSLRVLNRSPGTEPLQLFFAVQAECLELQVNEAENFVYFADVSGEEVVRYSDLHVFDATGRGWKREWSNSAQPGSR